MNNSRPQSDKQYVSYRITKQRKRLGYTIVELAKMTGLKPQTISKIENCHHLPSYESIKKIAFALKKSPCYFLVPLLPVPEQEFGKALNNKNLDTLRSLLRLSDINYSDAFVNSTINVIAHEHPKLINGEPHFVIEASRLLSLLDSEAAGIDELLYPDPPQEQKRGPKPKQKTSQP